jgi:signal transduction histidine kinase/CheY-like chemotaxis protein/HPt (histidine-containing phosphotransfer) domain-containing protein
VVLSANQSTSILYDLAMAMAGETRPKPLAHAFLQRLLEHTGCGCGACVVRAESGDTVLDALGNRALRGLEGHPSPWSARPVTTPEIALFDSAFAGGESYQQGICLPLENVGHIVLLSSNPVVLAEALTISRALFAPVLSKFARTLKLCIDTERAEDALRQSISVAEAASRAKSAFLANMSHEIRTPLNAILGLTHHVHKDVTDPVARQKLERVTAAAQHLLQLLKDVLDLSKIEAERLAIDNVEFAPRTVVDQVLSIMGQRASAKGLRLRGVIASDVPRIVRGDPFRTQQILLNYVGNATKFSERGTIEVRVSVEQRHEASLLLKFSVSDQGVGLSQTHQRRLFQAFSQADDSSTRRNGGTGLGLAICRRLAALMNGDTGVASELGVGSTFWATLRVGVVDEQWRGPALASPDVPKRPLRLTPARILVAEDDASNQEVMRCLLEDLGMHVTLVDNGAAAIDAARRESFALVMLDVQMPVMDGIDAARALRTLDAYKSVPIIAATANSFLEDQERCIAAGMTEHLSKPIDPRRLRAVLERWLPTQANEAPVERRSSPALPAWLAESPAVDAASAVAVLEGRVALYLRLVRAFVRDRSNDAAALRVMIDEARWSDARRAAHTLKSVSATLGAGELATRSAELERRCMRGTRDEALDQCLSLFVVEFERVQRALAASVERDEFESAAATDGDVARVRELRELLKQSDATAVSLVTERADELRRALGGSFAAIATLVEQFDFDAALALIDRGADASSSR